MTVARHDFAQKSKNIYIYQHFSDFFVKKHTTNDNARQWFCYCVKKALFCIMVPAYTVVCIGHMYLVVQITFNRKYYE